jgi:hypothetical protein
MTMKTTETTETATATETAKIRKTTAITLTSGATTLKIHARRQGKTDAFQTFVTTSTGEGKKKTTTRGMTETHPSFDAAALAIATQATKAEKLGWVRKVGARGFARAADAFFALPAPPKPKK